MGIEIIALLLFIATSGYIFLRRKKASQLAYIDNYEFHPRVLKKIKEKYPHLNDRDVELVIAALRDYFHICNIAKRRMVAMPSQVVDVAWHEFILITRAYKQFCKKAIGRFLHHTPTEAMRTPTLAQEGIKRAWRLACSKEEIDPRNPNRLPMLFAIDGMLNIGDGFKYSPNCKDRSSPAYGDGYCAGHIGCTSGCAGDSGSSSDSGGFFEGIGDSGDSSGCGCGGGCGGD
jgi:hypothetical protein